MSHDLELARKLACEALEMGRLAPKRKDVETLHDLLETLKDGILPG